jgi:hypothetical protein
VRLIIPRFAPLQKQPRFRLFLPITGAATLTSNSDFNYSDETNYFG